MGNNYNNRLRLALLASLAVAGAPYARADQTSAQQDAHNVHDNGSSDSLNSSYGNALNALGNFYQLNLPGAISHGVKAYGQYRNSQTMDELRDQNQKLAGSMATAGEGGQGVSTVTGGGAYVSPYAKLDTKFLYEGATGEAASKIEKLSGLSREAMFKMAVNVHTNSKSASDPDFIPWAMSIYKGMVAKVPNEEFRSGLESFGKLAQKAIDTGAARTVLAKFTDSVAEPATMVAQAATAASPEVRVPASDANVEAVLVEAATARKEESALGNSLGFSARGSATTGVNASLLGLDRIGGEPVEGFLGDAMKRAGEDSSPSIFQTVSGKIKELNVRQRLERGAAVAQLPR